MVDVNCLKKTNRIETEMQILICALRMALNVRRAQEFTKTVTKLFSNGENLFLCLATPDETKKLFGLIVMEQTLLFPAIVSSVSDK